MLGLHCYVCTWGVREERRSGCEVHVYGRMCERERETKKERHREREAVRRRVDLLELSSCFVFSHIQTSEVLNLSIDRLLVPSHIMIETDHLLYRYRSCLPHPKKIIYLSHLLSLSLALLLSRSLLSFACSLILTPSDITPFEPYRCPIVLLWPQEKESFDGKGEGREGE